MDHPNLPFARAYLDDIIILPEDQNLRYRIRESCQWPKIRRYGLMALGNFTTEGRFNSPAHRPYLPAKVPVPPHNYGESHQIAGSLYGTPLTIATEQADSNLYSDSAKRQRFSGILATSYHTQSNSMVERTQYTLKTALSSEPRTSWPSLLLLVFALPYTHKLCELV